VGTFGRLNDLPIHPVALRLRRVERVEDGEGFAASHEGLSDGPDFLRATELVNFFVPDVLDVAASQLGRFHLSGLVCTPKENALPGGRVRKPERAHAVAPEKLDP